MDPKLNGPALPLALRIGGELFGNGITVQNQAIEHEREIHIGDAPLATQVFRIIREQCLRCFGHISRLSRAIALGTHQFISPKFVELRADCCPAFTRGSAWRGPKFAWMAWGTCDAATML